MSRLVRPLAIVADPLVRRCVPMVRVVELLPVCTPGFDFTALFEPFVQCRNADEAYKQADGQNYYEGFHSTALLALDLAGHVSPKTQGRTE